MNYGGFGKRVNLLCIVDWGNGWNGFVIMVCLVWLSRSVLCMILMLDCILLIVCLGNVFYEVLEFRKLRFVQLLIVIVLYFRVVIVLLKFKLRCVCLVGLMSRFVLRVFMKFVLMVVIVVFRNVWLVFVSLIILSMGEKVLVCFRQDGLLLVWMLISSCVFEVSFWVFGQQVVVFDICLLLLGYYVGWFGVFLRVECSLLRNVVFCGQLVLSIMIWLVMQLYLLLCNCIVMMCLV